MSEPNGNGSYTPRGGVSALLRKQASEDLTAAEHSDAAHLYLLHALHHVFQLREMGRPTHAEHLARELKEQVERFMRADPSIMSFAMSPPALPDSDRPKKARVSAASADSPNGAEKITKHFRLHGQTMHLLREALGKDNREPKKSFAKMDATAAQTTLYKLWLIRTGQTLEGAVPSDSACQQVEELGIKQDGVWKNIIGLALEEGIIDVTLQHQLLAGAPTK